MENETVSMLVGFAGAVIGLLAAILKQFGGPKGPLALVIHINQERAHRYRRRK